jgi:hypothetical protein
MRTAMIRTPILVAALTSALLWGCATPQQIETTAPPSASEPPSASREVDIDAVLETLVTRVEAKADAALQEALQDYREGRLWEFSIFHNGTRTPRGHVRALSTRVTSSEASATFEVHVRVLVEAGVGNWKVKVAALETTQVWKIAARPVLRGDGTLGIKTIVAFVSSVEKKERKGRTEDMNGLRDDVKERIVAETAPFVGEQSLDRLAEILQ